MTDQQNPELRRVASIYDELAPGWDRREAAAERVLIGKSLRALLTSHLRGDVLEIGTGTGITLTRLDGNAAVTSFTGLDLSSGMLDQARRHAAGLPFPVTLQQGNAGSLPFPDATFDTVTASLVLCTVPDVAHALQEMARVCRPDGRIVLLEHVRARNPLLVGMQKAVNPLQKRRMGCHLDRPTDRLVRKLGFRVELERTRLFGIFHLIVARPPSV